MTWLARKQLEQDQPKIAGSEDAATTTATSAESTPAEAGTATGMMPATALTPTTVAPMAATMSRGFNPTMTSMPTATTGREFRIVHLTA
jgi:hypothetical protein